MIGWQRSVRLIVSKRCFSRMVSTNATATSNETKEALKELRKRTGCSYVNCRKALNEFGVNHLNEATKWLKQKTIEEGWEKAIRVADRPTKQGVMSVLVKDHKAAIVELTCETDFVARNECFKGLVEGVTEAVLNSAGWDTSRKRGFEMLDLSIDCLKTLHNDKLVKDLIMEVIGILGENITLSKAQLLLAQPDVQLFGYAHPKEGTKTVYMGRYVSVVGLKRLKEAEFPLDKLGNQLCQHIVGMRSVTMGTPFSLRKQKVMECEEKKMEDETNGYYQGEVTSSSIDENETQLLRQAFMLNPTQTVYEYVSGHGVSIVDFYRAEFGENAIGKVI